MQNVFSILINWMSPFPILGLLAGVFHFYSNFKRNLCKQTGRTSGLPGAVNDVRLKLNVLLDK